MSNASDVSPFAAEPAPEPSVSLSASLSQWLSEGVEDDQRVKAAVASQRQQGRLAELRAGPSTCRPMSAVALNASHMAPLVQAAESQGYRRIRPIAAQSEAADNHRAAPVLLERPDGSRMALAPVDAGLVAYTTSPPAAVHAVVRQHVLTQALSHLAARGLQVQSRQRSGGEVEFIARETRAAADGKRPVKLQARVAADGQVKLDVDCKGDRCETIAADFAEAVGGRILRTRRKDRKLVLPGELARTKVKA